MKKVVFLSSAGTIYGLNPSRLNEDTMVNPFSPHGIFKLTIEKFLNYYHLHYNLNFDIYRIANAYGPFQDVKKGLGFINTSLTNIITNNEAVVYGDGSIVRDYVYVKDIAKLLTLSLVKPLTRSDLYIVSSGKDYSLNEILEKIKSVVPIPFKVKHIENRASDNKIVSLDNKKILEAFPKFKFEPLENGIQKTYNFIKESLVKA